MTSNSKIEWTDHTFNPWWGCARVSPACRSCYADATAQRWGHRLWRRNGDRRLLSDATWAQPVKWNRAAEQAGTPVKVFCASMGDVFEDHPQLAEPRTRLWQLIEATPWLRWQLLTKRPENIAAMTPWSGRWPEHVWLGVSAETQRWADTRVPLLLNANVSVRFVSAEPLLEPVDLSGYAGLSWVIGGGESGPRARRTDLEWLRSLRDQCAELAVPVFIKQLGSAWATGCAGADRKGGDWQYWPADLRVRQYPTSRAWQGEFR